MSILALAPQPAGRLVRRVGLVTLARRQPVSLTVRVTAVALRVTTPLVAQRPCQQQAAAGVGCRRGARDNGGSSCCEAAEAAGSRARPALAQPARWKSPSRDHASGRAHAVAHATVRHVAALLRLTCVASPVTVIAGFAKRGAPRRAKMFRASRVRGVPVSWRRATYRTSRRVGCTDDQ